MTAPRTGFPLADPAFDGQAVVVTGVGRAGQAGEVVARAFAERGAAVVCLNRSADVHDRVRELTQAGHRAAGYEVDLTDAVAAAALARTIAAKHDNRIAAVAALAGGFAMSGPLEASDLATYDKQIAINLTSAYVTARAFVPFVRAARGAFVFVTSAAVLAGGNVARMSAYAMAKGGLIQLVRALAQEERAHGVRVNALAPTALRTAANLEAIGGDFRYVEREELAMMTVLLCGPACARVSGQVIELA